MGQADHCHLGSHHRVGGICDLVQRLQEHLPHPGHHSHRQGVGHGLTTGAFIRRNGRVIRRLGGDLDHADPMGDFSEIAQHRHGVSTVGILAGQLSERPGCVALHHHVEQIKHPAPVGQPQHDADLIGGGFPGAVADRLIQQRLRITGRAFGGAGDQGQRVIGDLRAFCIGNALQHGDHVFRFYPAQVETLTARQHRHRHFADLGGGEDEFHMRGRFFQRLEQRVEGAGAKHMHFVDDVDLVACRGSPVMHRVYDLADVTHAGARCGVHLHHVDMAAFHDRHAMFAFPARVDRWATLAVRPDAVHPLGNDPGGGGFTGAADAGHDKGLGDAVGLECVSEGTHHRVLSDEVGKGFRPVFAGENLIAGIWGVSHGWPWDSEWCPANLIRAGRRVYRIAGGEVISAPSGWCCVRGPGGGVVSFPASIKKLEYVGRKALIQWRL